MILNEIKDIKSYIVASCNTWHYDSFLKAKDEFSAEWLWVDSPNELEAILVETTPRYIFFLHWNWYVPEKIYKKFECVCFHMTDVPYGRGGSPLQNLIINGQTETKLTALKMVDEMDAGPVYAKRSLSLNGKAQEIYEKAGVISFDIILWMINHNPKPINQDGEVVFFKRRKPEQSKIPEYLSPKDMYNFIRMLDADGYPHAFIEYGGFKLEFTNASWENDELSAHVNIAFKDV